MTVKAKCSVLTCPKGARSAGFCGAHYHRLKRHGDPTGGAPSRMFVVKERLDKHTGAPDANGCLPWQGQVNNKGYGMVSYHGAKTVAHLAAYREFVGDVPDGLELDHLCRNTICVNVDHLEPVTHAENQRRLGLAVTHCRKLSHPYTEQNTYRDGTGRRRCRECARIGDRKRARTRWAA